ncbi:phage tail tape measure protein [Novosphingobium lindaniclasticum]
MADKNLRLQVILEGLDRITSPLKSITGASSAARRDLAKTGEELKALGALQKQIGSYKSRESAFGADTRKLEETKARMADLRAQMEAAEAPTKKLAKEFTQAERQAAALAARLDKGGSELQELSSKLSAAGIDVADLARHEDRLSEKTAEANRALRQQTAQLEKVNQAKRNSDKLNEVSAKASGVGLGMVGAGIATAAPVVGAVKQAMTLESAMADVSKVTNMAAPQIERMSTDFLDMSENIPMAASELATIAAAAGAAGVGMDKMGKPMRDQRQQLLEFTNDAAEMGVAFDMTADQAGETMAKWRTAFELPQAGVRALGDGVNALTNRFGGKAANVTDIITRIGPLGKVAGLAAPEIAALGSTLDSIGIPSEVAATGIKNTMLALTKGAAATKGQRQAFADLGLEATDVAKRMQTDAAGAITDVMERIGKLDADKQSGILTQLFGSESVAAIAPMLTNLDGLKQRLQLVGDASSTAGSMHGEFLNRIAVTEGATGLAINALSGLNITMGKALLPTVKKVAGYVKSAASSMRSWAQENPALAKGLMIFLGVGAALLIVLGGIALAFAAVTAALAPLAGLLTISVAALFGWIIAIVAAVAAVAAVAYLIYNNWGAISAWFGSLWESIKAVFWDALGFIVNAFLNFTPLGLMMQAFAPVLAYLRGLNFADIGRHLIEGLIGGITGMLGKLKSTVTETASSVTNWFKQKLGIHSPSRVFAGLGGFVMAGLDQGLAANTSGPISRITDLSGQMTRALAVGAGGAAMSAALPAAAASGAPAASSAAARAAPANYHLHFHGVTGDPKDIADAVRRALEDIENERRGRGFGDEGA